VKTATSSNKNSIHVISLWPLEWY